MSSLLTCPLCDTPEIAPGVAGCFHSPQEGAEIERLRVVAAKTVATRAAFFASLPSRYRTYLEKIPPEIRTLNPQAAQASAKKLGPSSFMYLYGEGGIGKTHLAVRGAARLLEHGSTLYVNEEDYFDAVGEEIGGGPKAPDLTVPQVLIYDDAGKKTPSPLATQRIYRMLEKRWAGEKATIITANRSPELYAASLGRDAGEVSAILSRLRAGHVFELKGRDGRWGSAL